jgi:hypothetical protein
MLAFQQLFTFFKVCGSIEMSQLFLENDTVGIRWCQLFKRNLRGGQSQREKESEKDR